MQNHQLRNLKQAHRQFVAVMRAEGLPLLRYQTPCCGGTMQTAATDQGDSIATCIHCGSLFWRTVDDTTVTTK